ncbi:hypothetical protein [Prosthecobacter sp.]|uniref:hypothetical protein n=1 Tax=Prosthecobacter sp. TaxID=1965333 RepID=UPI001D95EC3B|nr:hypothetical protein [Prosthecobacter sp.]MCB1277484.1 hypothetical protein [Prosthecobacter sp.]
MPRLELARAHLLHRLPLKGVVAFSWLGLGCFVHATWQDDIGYTQLASELGASMPTGAGIILLQTEADSGASPPDYLPQAGGPGSFSGTSINTGKTFYPESGLGEYRSHAFTVSSYLYANDMGVARGVTEVHFYTANDFLSRVYNGVTPTIFPGRVQNHSWVGTTNDATTDALLLRRFDYMLNRDGCIAAVPLNNNSGAMPALMGNNYHALTAGVLSGVHSQGGTNTDGSGRMKPDLVVNEGETSYASPIIAGCAAVLLQTATASGNASAQKPQVIKAQLLAGASKKNLPQWRRTADAKPYDDVFGAGELNLRNAHYIQQGGQFTFSTSVERPSRGWDFASTTTGVSGRRYFFSIPVGRYARTFSTALTWHRSFSLPSYSPTLANLTLRLYAAAGFATVGGAISTSGSSVDNVEHLFLYNLPSGQYVIEVTSDTSNISYGLAWDAQLGDGPLLAPSFSGEQIQLDAVNLDPQATYTIESSPDLADPWTTEHTFRTADGTPAFMHSWQPSSQPAAPHFFRMRWTPVR